MASSVLSRRRSAASVRRTESHGRSRRSRRSRRRGFLGRISLSRSGYGVVAVLVLVTAASASALTSVYLLSLVNY